MHNVPETPSPSGLLHRALCIDGNYIIRTREIFFTNRSRGAASVRLVLAERYDLVFVLLTLISSCSAPFPATIASFRIHGHEENPQGPDLQTSSSQVQNITPRGYGAPPTLASWVLNRDTKNIFVLLVWPAAGPQEPHFGSRHTVTGCGVTESAKHAGC